jgi:hypothetical protein
LEVLGNLDLVPANGLRIEIEVVQNAPAAPEKERTR